MRINQGLDLQDSTDFRSFRSGVLGEVVRSSHIVTCSKELNAFVGVRHRVPRLRSTLRRQVRELNAEAESLRRLELQLGSKQAESRC